MEQTEGRKAQLSGENIGFERIRRITGYLGLVSKWGDAKKAELSDRTPHLTGNEIKSLSNEQKKGE